LGPVVFTHHGVLVDDVLIAVFHGVQLSLELVNIFLLRQLHLLQNFLLGQKFTIKVFGFGKCLVDFMLELLVLLSQGLNHAMLSAVLDLGVLDIKRHVL